MPWIQIMPVRMVTDRKTLTSNYVIPVGVHSIRGRLILDQADLENPAKEIRITVVDDTGEIYVSSLWRGGTENRDGTFHPPNLSIQYRNSSRELIDLGGRRVHVEIDTLENTRFGAEVELS